MGTYRHRHRHQFRRSKIAFSLLVLVLVPLLVTIILGVVHIQSGIVKQPVVSIRYLAFQVFTSGNPTMLLAAPPSKAAVES